MAPKPYSPHSLHSPSILATAAALLLALGTYGCDPADQPIDEDELERLEDELEAATTPTRIYDGEGFTLSTAQVPPSQTVRTDGPLTLHYVGPHRYVAPVDEVTLEEPEDGSDEPTPRADGGSGVYLDGVRLIDEQGHEWAVTGFDVDQVQQIVHSYRAGMTQLQALAAPDGHTNWGDIDDLASPADPQLAPNWTEFDCGFSTKWRFNNGSSSDLQAMNNSQRRPILDTNGTGFNGTAVLIADNLAITAGHVASALVNGDSMCRRFSTNGTQCRNVSSLIVNGNGGGDDDWGLIKFSSDFTGGLIYSLSSHSDGQINNHTPRIAAYPTLRRNEEAICGSSSLLEGERNLGNYHALLQKDARVDLTAGGGSSGAPYYFYEGGEYWIFGIHSQRKKTTLGNRYARGPKIPYWLNSIVASASALGVSL